MNKVFSMLVVGTLTSLLIYNLTGITTNSEFYKPNYFKDPTFQNLPFYEWFYKIYAPHSAYAQDEEEEEEEDVKDKDEEEEEEQEEGEENSSSPIAEPLEEIGSTLTDLSLTKEQIETQEEAIKEDLGSFVTDGSSWLEQNTSNVTTTEIPAEPTATTMTPIPEPAASLPTGQYLDPQCECITTTPPMPQSPAEPELVFNLTDDQTFSTIPPPPSPAPEPAPKPTITTVAPPPVQLEPEVYEQIIIKDRLDPNGFESKGEVTDPVYTNTYHSYNVFDNVIDDVSFWSQSGANAGFTAKLSEPLNDYKVCQIEVNAYKANGVPFAVNIGSAKNVVTDVLDQTQKTYKLDKCVNDVNQIQMGFNSPNNYTSISELKLFGVKLPTPQTPQPPQQEPPINTNNATKINITNSNAEINILNSTVTFKFDPQSAKATNYNIVTIPAEVMP